jgi:hypothetical protein
MKQQCLNNLLPEIQAKAKHFSFYQNSQFHCECLTGENKESEEVGLQDSLHRISYHTRLERPIQADSRTIMHIHTQVMSNLSTVKFIEVKYIKIALCKSQLHKALPEQHNRMLVNLG